MTPGGLPSRLPCSWTILSDRGHGDGTSLRVSADPHHLTALIAARGPPPPNTTIPQMKMRGRMVHSIRCRPGLSPQLLLGSSLPSPWATGVPRALQHYWQWLLPPQPFFLLVQMSQEKLETSPAAWTSDPSCHPFHHYYDMLTPSPAAPAPKSPSLFATLEGVVAGMALGLCAYAPGDSICTHCPEPKKQGCWDPVLHL